MFKQLKKFRVKLNNKGNSFVMVIVTVSFLMIIVSALLTAVMFNYKMKSEDLKAKNDFYYVEKALDEIQASIGADAIECLQEAYIETLESLVYYDPAVDSYVTMSNAEANTLLTRTFLSNFSDLGQYADNPTAATYIDSYFIKEAENPVEFITDNFNVVRDVTMDADGTYVLNSITFENIVLKRTTAEGYVQSITTDIVIDGPDFAVSFSDSNYKSSNIFDYALIADTGIEFRNGVVSVVGNAYGAADFNKDEYLFNTTATSAGTGITQSSRYSGIYANNATVTMQGANIIVPGTICGDNGSNLTITGTSPDGSRLGPATIWCDNMVLTGTTGAKLQVNATCNVADDLQLDAPESDVKITGEYYGYSFAASGDGTQIVSGTNTTEDGKVVKAHTNSSAIVINGENSSLDFSAITRLVIAGRAYIDIATKQMASAGELVYGTTLTEDSIIVTHNKEPDGVTDVQDYMTGESLSIKSNQIAYMVPMLWRVTADCSVISYPASLSTDLPEVYAYLTDPSRSTVVQYSIPSGDTYYFFYFDDPNMSEDYFKWYTEYSRTEMRVTNVLDNTLFEVNKIVLPSTARVYSSGALTVKNGVTATVSVVDSKKDPGSIEADASGAITVNQMYLLSNELKQKYGEVQYLLGDALTPEQHTDLVGHEGESPIKYYVDYASITGELREADYIAATDSYVWITNENVTVTAADCDGRASVRGIIICMGDVTFDSSITNFDGLVIAAGKIKTSSNIKFTADGELVRSMIAKDDADDAVKIKNFLNVSYDDTLDPSAEERTVDTIDYTEILSLENWQKNVE